MEEEGFLVDVDQSVVFDRILDVENDKKMYIVVVKDISPSPPVSLLFL